MTRSAPTTYLRVVETPGDARRFVHAALVDHGTAAELEAAVEMASVLTAAALGVFGGVSMLSVEFGQAIRVAVRPCPSEIAVDRVARLEEFREAAWRHGANIAFEGDAVWFAFHDAASQP